MPKVSVVIPLYNKEKYVARAVNSVLTQTFRDFELIVVDDGSSDHSAVLVEEFADSRIRLIRQENSGVSAARNRGILESTGEFIAFLDADDEWDSGFLDTEVALSELYPQAGILGTGYRIIFPLGPQVEVTAVEARAQRSSLLIEDYFYRAMGGVLINASGVMIPRKVFVKTGPFLVGERFGEDLEMWARIALYYPIAYNTRIMFSVHQTPMMEKPRFRELFRSDPKLKMLSLYLNGAHSGELLAQKIILRYLRHCFMERCFWHILNTGSAATLKFIDGSEAASFFPMLKKMIRKRILWPFIRIAARLSGYFKSRLVLKCTGGQRVSYGIFYRLGRAKSRGVSFGKRGSASSRCI